MDDIVNLKKNTRNKRLKRWLPIIIGVIIGIMLNALNLTGHFESQSFWQFLGSFMVTLAFALAGIPIGIIVHELGHLVFGLLTGYSFSFFSLGPLNWYKDGGRIRFKISPSLFAGQCLMIPPRDKKNFEFILYNLGGVIFNAVSCLVIWVIILLPILPLLRMGLIFVLLQSVVFVISNGIPMTWMEAPNDGANIREALKSKAAARAFYMQLYINHELSKGKRLREFDYEKDIMTKEGADLSNYLIAWRVMLEAEYWVDCGDTERAFEVWGRLDIKRLPPGYRRPVNHELLYYYCCYNPAFDKARELYSELSAKNELHKLPTRHRTAYEFFVLGEKEDGRKSLAKAEAAAYNLPNKGIRVMEMEYISILKTRMEETIDNAIK